MGFNNFHMANPDQKTLLIENAFTDIREICKKFQEDSGSSNAEVIYLLKELANLWDTKEKTNSFSD